MLSINLKSKSKLLLGSLLVLSFLFLGLNNASAVGDASFPQDTTLVINSQNYTILGGSDADSVVANPTNAVITVSAGQSITITSANRYRLDNDGGFTTTCTSSLSTLVISAASTTVVTVTPNTSALLCETTGGNQGSGRDVGGGGPAPTPTPSLTPIPSTSVTPTPTVTVTPTPTTSSTPGLVLHKLLRTTRGSKIYAQGADGTWHWIRTLAEFNAGGYKWSDVKVISATAFAKLNVHSKITVQKGAKWVNIRTSPSAKGKVIGKFLNGNEFDKLDYSNGWYKISLSNGQIGWVSGTVVNEN